MWTWKMRLLDIEDVLLEIDRQTDLSSLTDLVLHRRQIAFAVSFSDGYPKLPDF